jgi:hypothetical protein
VSISWILFRSPSPNRQAELAPTLFKLVDGVLIVSSITPLLQGVSSFNWRDVPAGSIRQLNNQNYNICFRTELIDRQVGIKIFYSILYHVNDIVVVAALYFFTMRLYNL